MAESSSSQPFQIERHGEIAIITPSPEVEKMPDGELDMASKLVLAPLRNDPPTTLIFDLSKVEYIGSAFLSFMLRCHKRVKEHDCDVVVAVPPTSTKVRELLHMTALDTLWGLYDNREEALADLNVD